MVEKSLLEIFQPDPDWEFETIAETKPRSPQAVFVDGVVVGHIIEVRYGENYVKAVDPDIQTKLEEWYELYKKKQERLREIKRVRFQKEVEKKELKQRNEARKVMGLPPIGEV
mgnify:FL=1